MKVFTSTLLFFIVVNSAAQNVGIGTTTPNAELQLSNGFRFRKLALYETANNDHQFIGLGNMANGNILGTLRYQVDHVSSNHIFYAATGTNSSNELVRITGGGNVGIDNPTPHAPLHFADAEANRKIVLFEQSNNNHQFFGFGINTGILRYQVNGAGSSHVFFAGNGNSASTELVRITGSGNVGIGTASPNAQLQFSNGFSFKKMVLYETANNDHQFIGLGNMANGNILGTFRYQVDATSSNHIFYAATSSSSSNELVRITGTGNVGIGVSAPHAPLQFADAEANRKIVLFESGNNDHQFFGFGLNNGILRYQVNATGGSHAFFAGNGNAASVELARITGAGNVGIGTGTPNAPLQFANTAVSRKMVLYETGNNDHQFFGMGINASAMRYQVDATNSSHVFYAGTGTATSLELMRISGIGNVGIGNAQPHAPLQFANVEENKKIVFFEQADNDHQFFGMGINTSTLRYQVSNTGSDHVFFAATGTSASIELARIKGNGTMGIGIASPSHILHINGVGRSTSSTWATTSDERAKKNIATLHDGSLQKILKLRPVTYQWKEEFIEANKGLHFNNTGFISQEVEQVFPEMIERVSEKLGTNSITDFRLLNLGELPAHIVKAIQEQQAIIQKQQEQINLLIKRVEVLEKR
jgi:Chaperone of endosialidase